MSDSQPMIETTVVASGSEQARPALPTPIRAAEASWAPADYIKPSLIRYANYDYQTGTTFFLSKTEQIVVDAYLKTNNEAEAVRTVNAIYTAHGSPRRFGIKAIHRWLQKPHIAQYIAKVWESEGKANYFKKEEDWYAYGMDVLMGKLVITQVQTKVWEVVGKSKGWSMPDQAATMNNVQINFTQSSGEK